MKKEDFYDKYILREGDLLPERIVNYGEKLRLYGLDFFKKLQDRGLLFDNLEAAEEHYRCIMASMKKPVDEWMLYKLKTMSGKAKKRIYISGPISGHTPEECRKRFEEVEQLLIGQGYRVFNPMKNGLPFDADTHRHMRRDLNVLTNEDDPFDYIYMMKRWPHSSGCKTELDNAIACGISVMWEESGEITKFE